MATFTARRSEPELVAPARATPHERKFLSDIDCQHSLRFYATCVEFFCASTVDGSRPHDPAKAIRSALADALVFFYPVAGRLREHPEGKLEVDCTAEGVVFVEADADVRLEELGEPLLPPYPCVEEFLCDPGDTKVVIGKPLFFMQVTRLKCGGFVVGFHMCHNMSDAFGMFQFIGAIGDLARGEALPAVIPMWGRELLTACLPPGLPHNTHLAYEQLPDGTTTNDIMQSTQPDDMVGQYFFFGPTEISAMRSHVPVQFRESSTIFELLAATIWQCRTAASGYALDQIVRFMFTSNSRGNWKRDPPIPEGFYGCGLVFPVAETTVAELCGSPFGHALELVRQAKFGVTDEYVRSTVGMIAGRKWPPLVVDRTYVVSDITSIGEEKLDFGWGKRVGGGVPMAGDIMSKSISYFMKCKDIEGEDCVAVPMYLPSIAMDRFAVQISVWSKKQGKKFSLSSQ